jgi:hypothetical protein
MLAGRSIFRDFWLEERGAGHGIVMLVLRLLSHIWKFGGKTGGPHSRKSAWSVHEPQILPSAHARSPPCHLQVGRELGRRPVLTAASHSQKVLKVATPTAKARGDPGPAALQEDS